MAIWTKYLNPEDLLLTKVKQGIEQLNLDILISASMPSFSDRFHSSFSPLILASSSLLLVTAPSNSKTFPPSYYALPFNLLLFPFYCWKQVYKEFFSSSKDLPTMGSSSFVGLWPNCYHSSCSSRFLPNATAVPSQFLSWTQATASCTNHLQPGQATTGPADRLKHLLVELWHKPCQEAQQVRKPGRLLLTATRVGLKEMLLSA